MRAARRGYLSSATRTGDHFDLCRRRARRLLARSSCERGPTVVRGRETASTRMLLQTTSRGQTSVLALHVRPPLTLQPLTLLASLSPLALFGDAPSPTLAALAFDRAARRCEASQTSCTQARCVSLQPSSAHERLRTASSCHCSPACATAVASSPFRMHPSSLPL
jgi:hypothetical protein